MTQTKTRLILSLIFLVAVFFRFFQGTDYPVSFSMDEVSIGYNAYSILTTGQDEWGEAFPLTFRSVGDYKPPVNVYLTAVSMAIFGFNEFAVRVPSALIGSLSVIAVYGLLRSLKFSKQLALLGSVWVAISPWHVYFSRASFEAVVALFFVICGIWLFLEATNEKSQTALYLGLISFSLSVWTYHAERAFVPLLVISLIVLRRKALREMFVKKPKSVVVSFVIVLFFAVPFLHLSLFTPAVTTRALSTSIFRDVSLTRELHGGEYNSLAEYVFDNDIFLILRHFLGKYLNYFDVEFLFGHGLSLVPRDFPGMGLMYLVDLPIIAIGIYALVFHKNKLLRNLSLTLLFLGVIPAAITMNEQHALRALTWFPFWFIAFVAGVELVFSTKFKFKKLAVSLYAFALGINILYFSDMYFRQFPHFYAEYWQYGFKEAALIGCSERENYDTVLITDTFGTDGPLNTGIPYIYVLFYCQIPPREFLDNNREIPGFDLRRPDWKSDSKKKMLMIAAPYDFPLEEIDPSHVTYIDYPSGERAFAVVRSEGNK